MLESQSRAQKTRILA